ncbi:MAG: hypothetical protein HeimC2_00820, partial [Candidatus Heimdallarchaeota archaeon LC_2]
PANNINVALGTGVGITVHQIIVAPGSVYARFNLFDAFVSGEPDLITLSVLKSRLTLMLQDYLQPHYYQVELQH